MLSIRSADDIAKGSSAIGKIIAFDLKTAASQLFLDEAFDRCQVALPAEWTSLADNQLQCPAKLPRVNFDFHASGVSLQLNTVPIKCHPASNRSSKRQAV